MAYKGNELRARTMQYHSGFPYGNHAGSAGEQPRASNGTLSGSRRLAEAEPPAGQDEIVTACCDLAYEAARAGGSREVILVHLVHALTRVPDAAKILDAEGVGVAALRRDTAEIIFSDMPVGQAFGSPPSNASDDFNTAMELAGANMQRRGAYVTSVVDVLVGVINGDPDALTVQLLQRHWANWQDAVVDDLAADAQPGSTPATLPTIGQSGSGHIESRLRAVETAMSTLIGEISGDRNSFGQLLRDMQDAMTGHRTDTNRLQTALSEQVKSLEHTIDTHRLDVASVPAGLLDRVGAFESSMEEKIDEAMQVWQTLGTRLEDIEHKLDAQPIGDGHTTPQLLDKLATFERGIDVRLDKAAATWGTMRERMASLEKAVSAETSGDGHLQALLSDRMQAMEKMLEGQQHEIANQLKAALPDQLRALHQSVEETLSGLPSNAAGNLDEIAEQIGALELAVSDQRAGAEDISKAYEAQLGEIRSALGKLATSQQTLTGALDQWRLDTTGDLGIISNRLETLEHMSVRPVEMLEQLNVSLQSSAQPARKVMAVKQRGFWRWLFGVPSEE